MRRSSLLMLIASVVVLAPSAFADRKVINVYFGWEETALDATGKAVVAKAAPQARACEYNGVRVVGHADTSHAIERSSELATARAQTVRKALAADGVADSAISATGHSENDLAVQTPDGVREPLNRRVEIIIVCD